MAACTLKIELDEPFQTRKGGEQVTGTVNVQCHKDIKCDGLEVRTEWTTHGRGNVDSGVCDSATLYTGTWQAGQSYQYPFKLHCATWPPTYNGNFLNVRHAVHAQAKIAWAIDPKTAFEFPVVADASPLDLQPVRQKSKGGVGTCIGWGIAAIFLAIFGFFFLWLLPIVLIVGGAIWFFNVYLPKQLTGVVECDVQPQRAKPGTLLRGSLKFTPRRNLSVNGIRYRIRCLEKCVSGSGSNRRTHTHELVDRTEVLVDARVLPVGQPLDLSFEYLLPPQAAPSLELTDNSLAWTVEMRIDIPRWPDWSKEIKVIVEPTGEVVTATADGFVAAPPLTAEDQWTREVLEQLQQSGQDPERLALVLQAVREHQLKMTVILEEPAVPAPAESPAAGTWFQGTLVEPELDVYLFVPQGMPTPGMDVRWVVMVQIVDYKPSDEALTLHMVNK